MYLVKNLMHIHQIFNYRFYLYFIPKEVCSSNNIIDHCGSIDGQINTLNVSDNNTFVQVC